MQKKVCEIFVEHNSDSAVILAIFEMAVEHLVYILHHPSCEGESVWDGKCLSKLRPYQDGFSNKGGSIDVCVILFKTYNAIYTPQSHKMLLQSVKLWQKLNLVLIMILVKYLYLNISNEHINTHSVYRIMCSLILIYWQFFVNIK